MKLLIFVFGFIFSLVTQAADAKKCSDENLLALVKASDANWTVLMDKNNETTKALIESMTNKKTTLLEFQKKLLAISDAFSPEIRSTYQKVAEIRKKNPECDFYKDLAK